MTYLRNHLAICANNLSWWITLTNPKGCSLCEKCPNMELFLGCIFPYTDWIRTRNNTVFGHFSLSVLKKQAIVWLENYKNMHSETFKIKMIKTTGSTLQSGKNEIRKNHGSVSFCDKCLKQKNNTCKNMDIMLG